VQRVHRGHVDVLGEDLARLQQQDVGAGGAVGEGFF
jgi:hypothetical protein